MWRLHLQYSEDNGLFKNANADKFVVFNDRTPSVLHETSSEILCSESQNSTLIIVIIIVQSICNSKQHNNSFVISKKIFFRATTIVFFIVSVSVSQLSRSIIFFIFNVSNFNFHSSKCHSRNSINSFSFSEFCINNKFLKTNVSSFIIIIIINFDHRSVSCVLDRWQNIFFRN